MYNHLNSIHHLHSTTTNSNFCTLLQYYSVFIHQSGEGKINILIPHDQDTKTQNYI